MFDGVWFAYPNTDRFVLKDVNLTIYAVEKISVVGQNGAGKTLERREKREKRKEKRERGTAGGGVDKSGYTIYNIGRKNRFRLVG